MQHFILNTDALALGKEDAILPWPEREKNPIYFYLRGEKKPHTVYASTNVFERYLKIQLFGMETNPNLRGMHLKVGSAPMSSSQYITVRTSYDTNISLSMIRDFWPGGPYSFLKGLVMLEEEASKGTDRETFCWLRQYLLDGGIGQFAEKRMRFNTLFEKFAPIF